MRILFVNDMAAPYGGAEVLTLLLRDSMRDRGHDARLFASDALAAGRSGPADYYCLGTVSSGRTLLQTANPWAASALERVVREFRPDVVHVTMFLTQLSPLVLPVLRAVPTVAHAVWYRMVCPLGTKVLPDGTACGHQWGAPCLSEKCLPLRDWVPLMAQRSLTARWRNALDAVIAISESVRGRLEASGIPVVSIVPGAIPVREHRPPLSGPPMALFAGRLVREKGADVLVRAFATVLRAIPDARLVLVGSGPERPALERLLAELHLTRSVDFHAHVSRAEVERIADTAWVQAVPSTWEEPFGLVAAEAMMRGTAVIASRAGGLAEIVSDPSAGVLVPPGDHAALADALLSHLTDRARCERAGSAGRAIALRRFAAGVVSDAFLEVYANLAHGQSLAAASP